MGKKKITLINTKSIKIISQFNAQFYPLDETAIEITEDDLNNIGVTKCFDVENNCVIDYNGKNMQEK